MLDVADLDDAAVLAGGGEDALGLGERRAERLLNQEVRLAGQQRQGDLLVAVSRHDDRDGIARLAEFLERGEAPAVELLADLLGAGVAGLVDPDEFRARQGRIDARMVLAQGADAGDAAADFR